MSAPEHAHPLTPPHGQQARRIWQRDPGTLMIIGGVIVAIAGYLAAHTTLLLAYKAGDLATVHAMCSSGIGELARGLNATAARNCQQADGYYTLTLVALFGGIALAVGGFVVLTSRMSRR